MSIGESIAAGWQERSAAAYLLLPIAMSFAGLVAFRRFLYRSGILRAVRLPVPVIVVGNITAGGSGKTPLVLHLAQELAQAGRQPGIISRGYGGSVQGVQEVGAASDPAVVGDEPLLLKRRAACPVFVGRDRVAAARALLAAHPQCDVIVSDDGLQHYRLARDIEIAAIDERGIGNGWPLPAGPLRECPHQLETADAVVLTGAAQVPAGVAPRQVFRMSLAGERFYNLRHPQRSCAAADLRGKRLHALAGIGSPARFFRQLEDLGLRFVPHGFPDHHAFRPVDLEFKDADALLMTEKDAVKCQAFAPEEAWVLPVEARLDPDLGRWTAEKLNGCPPD